MFEIRPSTRNLISLAAALSVTGCGYAVRDAVQTSGEAAQRAGRHWEGSRAALELAEEARDSARGAAAAAAAPPSFLRDRNDFLDNRADDARGHAEDAEARANDAADHADDIEDRAGDAERAAERAFGWLGGRGFRAIEAGYADCNQYPGSRAFDDQPQACDQANEARALAELVRWQARRARTTADHAGALAEEARAASRAADAERLTGPRRTRLQREAETSRAHAADRLVAVNAEYASQDREWSQLVVRAREWLAAAERRYAAVSGARRLAAQAILGRLPGASAITAARIEGTTTREVPQVSVPPVRVDRTSRGTAPGPSPPTGPLASSGPVAAPVEAASDSPSATRRPTRAAAADDGAAGVPFGADDFLAWMNGVGTEADAAEAAADDAEATSRAQGPWLTRKGNCVVHLHHLNRAAERVVALTIGDARPPGVTAEAGEATHAGLAQRIETARTRAQAACDSIVRPQ